ncbi:hypothetical protein Ddc_15476 [Ditylenchus destructor]|nr:hypothetical protein Ddc_15476 [Ditylenchus destructor]
MPEKADSPMPNGTVKRKNSASSSEVGSKIANKKLMESDKAQFFRIIFPIYDGSNGEVEEFRLENNRTRKVLQLRRVTRKEVEKYCEFKANTKYFILENSRA